MSIRSATIYVEPRTIKRLRLLLRLYPQHTTEVGNIRDKTADEVADALINEAITTNYPLVKQLEKLLASTEKAFMEEKLQMSEPSEEAREAAEKWGNKHSGALSRGWQHVFACGYDAATAKLRAELADAEILCRELQEQRAKLSAEHERLTEELSRYRNEHEELVLEARRQAGTLSPEVNEH